MYQKNYRFAVCFEHGCANGARVSEVLFQIACVLQVKTKLPLGNDDNDDDDDELIPVEIRLSSSYDNIIQFAQAHIPPPCLQERGGIQVLGRVCGRATTAAFVASWTFQMSL